MKTEDKPGIQEFHLSGVKHVLPEDALEAKNNQEVVFIDVREKYEIYPAHIENVLFYPMWEMGRWLPGLPKDQKYVILCDKGMRSTHVANFMMQEGFKMVFNLDGGITAWKERNLPYVAFKHPKKA